MVITKFFTGDNKGLSDELEFYFNCGIIKNIDTLKIKVIENEIDDIVKGIISIYMIQFECSDKLEKELLNNKNMNYEI